LVHTIDLDEYLCPASWRRATLSILPKEEVGLIVIIYVQKGGSTRGGLQLWQYDKDLFIDTLQNHFWSKNRYFLGKNSIFGQK